VDYPRFPSKGADCK